ncbi:hypothetical protein ACJMK2_004427 [Sinanodonta woodiana]|uniref:BRICHOS domain-containing protein n=1 Tax=Sinanodonta woodiana TaxID=1069815 RepID=A0ABD3Y3A6_SINWO
MKPMANEMKADLSTITVQAAMEPKSPEELKEKRKRLRIIAIAVVVLVIVVVAAIITAVCVAGKQAEENIKTAMLPYKDESGKSSTQKVTSLFVYRPEQMSKQSCFLTAVNTSYLLSPDKMKSVFGQQTAADVSSQPPHNDYFISTNVVVPNKDFLSPLSKELCKDTEVIWMVPKPDCVDTSSTRAKRYCYYRYICYYYVYNGYVYYECYWVYYCE